MTYVKNKYISRDSYLKDCLLRHRDRRHSEEPRAKFIGKRIHVWGLVALPLPQKLQICKVGDIRVIRRLQAYSSKNDELRKDASQEYNSSFPWKEHEIITLLQKLDWKLYGRCTHSYRRKTKISFTMESVQFILCHGECTICLDKNASEAEAITDTLKTRKVNHQIRWRPEQNAKDWITCPQRRNEFLADKGVSHHCVPVYAGRRRCKCCQRKLRRKLRRQLFTKDKLSLDRTRSNTPKYMGSQNSYVVSIPRETERMLQDVELWPYCIGESQLAGREFTRTSSTYKECMWRWHSAMEVVRVHTLADFLFCVNWGSTSKFTKYISWWSSRTSSGHIDLSQLEKSIQKHHRKSRELRRSVSQRRMHRETEKPPLTSDWLKANWNKYQQEKSCSNYSVYDGTCAHTHLSHAHFSVTQFVCVLRTSSCVCTQTHGSRLKWHEKGVCTCVFDLSISPSPLWWFTRLPRCFLDGHFETYPDFTDDPIHMIFSYFLVLKSAGHAPLRTCIEMFGYLAWTDANTSYEPKEIDKITSVDNNTMLINDPNHNFLRLLGNHEREH